MIYVGFFQEGGSHDHLGGPMPIPETKFKIMTVAIVIATLIVGIKVPNSELHFQWFDSLLFIIYATLW